MQPLLTIAIAALIFTGHTAQSAETLLAGYFDIKTASPSGTEVQGKVNLLRNKDALTQLIPASYEFHLSSNLDGIFELINQRDSKGRLFGMLRVKAGKAVSSTPIDYQLAVELREDTKVLATAPVTIKAREKTLQETFSSYAAQHCKNVDRLFSRSRFSDDTVTALIVDVEQNNGRFPGYGFYEKPVSDYFWTVGTAPNLSTQWKQVQAKIGGMGYAYVNTGSSTYGPGANPANRLRLKNAIYLALKTFIDRIPLDPAEVLYNGSPIGTDFGDGLFMLNGVGAISHTELSQQFDWADPITGPVVWILPELLAEAKSGDPVAIALHEKIVYYFQISFGAPKGTYRGLVWPWGPIRDPNRSAGAFSDANIHHRFRSWLALPAIWNDYNRPITYMPYWYANYFPDGVLFMPGWTPRGVLHDYIFWTKNCYRESHLPGIAGFHPDGTVSHHLFGNTRGISMDGYGYPWLTLPLATYEMLKNTDIDLGSEGYNFMANHFRRSWDRFIYRGDFDYTMTGSFVMSNLRNLVSRAASDANRLLSNKQATTVIDDEASLRAWRDSIWSGTHQATGNFPFWSSLSMVQRRGGENANSSSHYFSVKMSNDRVSTGSFSTTYHSGSGILQVKVEGNEYDLDARGKMDWHCLPGLTEEWRTDDLPNSGSNNATGGSSYAAMASDGEIGFSHMRYRPTPGETYCSAVADKGFFFTGKEAVGLGCNISRRAPGQGRNIITTIDQTRWITHLTYSLNGQSPVTLPRGSAINAAMGLVGPSWLHQGRIGYMIIPQGAQNLIIRGLPATLPAENNAELIHIAIDHGVNPDGAKYIYVVAPNSTAAEMPARLAAFQRRYQVISNGDQVQGLYDLEAKVLQVAFHQAAQAKTSDGMTLAADRPAMVQLRRVDNTWKLSVSDPIHELEATEIQLKVKAPIRSGTYAHVLPGMTPLMGEPVKVSQHANGEVKIVVPLADPSDDPQLNYKAPLYAAVPIRVDLPANEPILVQDDLASGLEDSPLVIDVLANDGLLNPQAAKIIELGSPENGSVEVREGKIHYAPDSNWSGTDQFTYVVVDKEGDSSLANVTVTINSVNDSPTFISSQIRIPNGKLGLPYDGVNLSRWASDADPDDHLVFSKVSGSDWLTVASDGTLSGRPTLANEQEVCLVRVQDRSGAFAQATLVFSVTVLELLPNWDTRDVGAVGLAGSTWMQDGGNTVRGSGTGFSGTSDSFRYTWTTLTGDGEIRTRVSSLTGSSTWLEAGLMIRESDDTNSKHILLSLSPSRGIAFQYRNQAGAISTAISGPGINPFPNNWLSIIRKGNSFTAYFSTDGSNWSEVGSATVGILAKVQYGVVVSSYDPSSLATAVFDHLEVTPLGSGDSKLIRHWTLDDIRQGKVWESVSKTHNGTVQNGVIEPNGKIRKGIELSGVGSGINASGLGFSSNNLCVTAWIKRNGTQVAWSGIAMARGSSVASGLHFGENNELRYTWNEASNTFQWNSGLIVPDQTWSFVALSLNPSRATLYLKTGNELRAASREVSHSVEAFSTVPFHLGLDAINNQRAFKGVIDDVRVYSSSLPENEIAWISQQEAPLNSMATFLDKDGNRLSDAWEIQYLLSVGQNPTADVDFDGLTNEQEQSMGTHPKMVDTDQDTTSDGVESRLGLDALDPQENFALSIIPSAGGFQLSWASQAGCRFRIEQSADLIEWTTMIADHPGGTGLAIHIIPASGLQKRAFYRVSLLP